MNNSDFFLRYHIQKSDLLPVFGSYAYLARIMGISANLPLRWHEELPHKIQVQILGAALLDDAERGTLYLLRKQVEKRIFEQQRNVPTSSGETR